MKKSFLYGLLIATSLLIHLTACTDRRDEIAEKLTQDAGNSESIINGDFYAGMTSEDMLSLFESNSVLEAPSSGMNLVNTPYYYIMPLANKPGGYAYSKISGEFVTLCTDPYCNHSSCIFSTSTNNYISEYGVHDGRIYYLVVYPSAELDPTDTYQLYSTDFLLRDLRMDYEFPVSIDSKYEVNVEGDFSQVETDFVATIQNLCFYGDYLYYTDFMLNDERKIVETIYQLNLQTKELSVMSADIVAKELKLDGHVLSWIDGKRDTKYYDLNQNQYVVSSPTVIPTITLAPEYAFMSGVRGGCEEYSYVTVNHTTEMFRDDPYFSYYNEPSGMGLTTRDLFKRQGGQIYRVRTDGRDNGVPELIITLSTDGIPDVIYWYYTDGRTMIVCYETYKDFQNEYNTDSEETRDWFDVVSDKNYYKYAIVDMETGEVYKPET